MATNSIKLLTGNSYPELARLVADRYARISTQALQLRFSAFRPATALQCYGTLGPSSPDICYTHRHCQHVSCQMIQRNCIKIDSLTSDPTNTHQARNRAHQDPCTAILEPGDICYYRRVGQRRRWYARCSYESRILSSSPLCSLHTPVNSAR